MRKRKRGLLQRQQAAEQEFQIESCLYGLLMVYLAKGIMSGAQVHAIAQAAQSDIEKASEGYHMNDLYRIANLKQSKNLGRTIQSIMAKEADLPLPFEVSIPVKGSNPAVPSCSIMLPHELFSAFYNNAETWRKSVLLDPSELPAFWKTFKTHPSMKQHPLLQKPHYDSRVIPFGLHGDEVPVQGVGKIWCKCVLFFSWFSIMSNHLIWGIFEKYAVPSSDGIMGTMESFWALMRWSFNIMYEGRWPYRDWRGHE